MIGDPIGPAEEIPALLVAFERFCREHDWQFAFYQARPEHLAQYESMGWRALHLGEDPILWTDRFTLEGSAMGEVRRAAHKLSQQGLQISIFRPDLSPFSKAPDHDALLESLRRISNEWLADKPGGEKGFCMGRFDASQLDAVLLLLARDPAQGIVEAFCTWTPIPARCGWALDLMRRRREAPSGAMEWLIARSVEDAREHGEGMMSLSLSALVRVETGNTSGPSVGGSEETARAFLIERLARFYDFQGLFRWKRKFMPSFEARYLVYANPAALPSVALALVRAQSPAGLMSYLRLKPRATPEPQPSEA